MPQTLINILIPTGIMLGIALVLGLLIVLVSRAFAVEKNETKEKILEALPGANCGGCGFAGCEGYADYLSKNGPNTALCAVGGADCAREIASILGVAAAVPEKKVAVLRCQGTCEQTGKRYVYLGTSSCHAASGLLGGPNQCTFGCLGFGDCIAVCAFGALKLKDGIVSVDRAQCHGCGQCVKVCPKHLLELMPVSATVAVRCQNEWPGARTRKNCTIGCIGCQKCVRSCPQEAISMRESLAVIDQSKCVHCDACVNGCPTHAIAFLREDLKLAAEQAEKEAAEKS
ncbi:MAG: RnfABCDGE type electron transport complex subunit B [Clostridiales bacterium]|nr:RnfABCDGE type electron transport complex subunit B [Clostridiales bacterium]